MFLVKCKKIIALYEDYYEKFKEDLIYELEEYNLTIEEKLPQNILFEICNKQHQMLLKCCETIETKCWKNNYCNDDGCDGFILDVGKCSCGIKWYFDDDDVDFSDIS